MERQINQPGQPAGQPPGGQGEDKDIQDNKLIAALAYLWVISIIVLLVKKDSKFAQFHAKQGLVLFLASIIVSFIPLLGWFILNPIIWIIGLIGLIQALMGKYWKIPLVGDLAAKINL
jgi:uncharacterized membrane protein